MERIKISEETNFIGCWKFNDNKLCEDIINLFENNKEFHIKGVTGLGIDENVKKSTDMPVDPKNLNNDKFKILKIYMNKLFECYQDYKTTWPYLNRSFTEVDIPTFNVQKYEEGGHFSYLHCEREGISTMHRVFAWMTYLNDVEEALTFAEKGNLQKIKQLLVVLNSPYENQENIAEYQLPAPSSNKKYQTFCGT